MLEKFVYSKHAEIAVLLGCTKDKQSTSNSMNPKRKNNYKKSRKG